MLLKEVVSGSTRLRKASCGGFEYFLLRGSQNHGQSPFCSSLFLSKVSCSAYDSLIHTRLNLLILRQFKAHFLILTNHIRFVPLVRRWTCVITSRTTCVWRSEPSLTSSKPFCHLFRSPLTAPFTLLARLLLRCAA